jgi:hypothetical protein
MRFYSFSLIVFGLIDNVKALKRRVMLVHEGKEYARVSDILRSFCNFDHIDPGVLANKARIGTEVHQAIADDIAGGFPLLSDDCQGYYESYCKWVKQVCPVYERSEERYFNDEYMITGQIDAVINGEGLSLALLPTLVDFKTSAQESKQTWPMQAHLYNYLLATNGVCVGPKYLFIKLSKDGSLPQVFEYLWCHNTHIKCIMAINSFWDSHRQTKKNETKRL